MAASTGLTPEERSQRARLSAFASWANTPDRTARSQRGRDAFRESFDKKVDRDHPELDPEARAKMAEAAYRAHFARMAFEQAKRRREKSTNATHGRPNHKAAAVQTDSGAAPPDVRFRE
jgi:hypothetical protein